MNRFDNARLLDRLGSVKNGKLAIMDRIKLYTFDQVGGEDAWNYHPKLEPISMHGSEIKT